MAIPLLLPLLIGAGGWFAGKSGSGGGIEIATSKKSTQSTTSNQTTNTSTYAPTISRNYDIQYNIASQGSNISTKKEQAITQTPEVSPSITPSVSLIPTTNQGGGGSAEATTDFMGLAMVGAVGFGAYLFLTKDKGDKK